MTISFQYLAASTRIPGTYIEVQPSGDTALPNLQTLIIGNMLSSGTAVASKPVFVSSPSQAQTLFGSGSVAHMMAIQYFGSDSQGTVYVLPLADDPSSVRATGSVTASGSATVSATVAVYVAGQRFAVGVAAGDTSATFLTSLASEITAAGPVPFTFTVSAGVMTISARNGGIVGDADVRLNAGGTLAGESTPSGLSVTVASLTGGQVNPSLTAGLANLADEAFEFIALPFTDSTSLNSIALFLNESSGRWSPIQQLFGMAFSAISDTASNLITFGQSRNDPHTSVLAYPSSPNWAPIVAAEYCAQCAVSLRADPGLPLQDVNLNIASAAIADRLNYATRSTLLNSGLSTLKYGPDGSPILERSCTTYQYDSAGVPDDSFLNTETLECLAYTARSIRQMLQSTFGRKKLAPDTARVTPASSPTAAALVTPSLIKTHVVATYRLLEDLGVVVDSDTFAQQCQVENEGGGRVSIFAPVTLVGQLRVIGVALAFQTF